VLPLLGIMTQRSSWLGTSTDAYGRALWAAVADPSVSAICLEVDSPGGQAEGTEELATRVRAARTDKPVVAVANSLAASAAYWVASQATELMVTPSGEVGSIGVFYMHQDFSGALAEDGVEVTFLSAGEGKTDANPFEPLSGSARADLQGRVDSLYGMFSRTVALGRGVGVETVRRTWKAKMCGARQAVELGLADSVGTLSDAIDRATELARDRRSATFGRTTNALDLEVAAIQRRRLSCS
jgi:signal peptide peptidase SppA